MALKLFLAVWVTVVTTAAVTNASPPKPRCHHVSVNSYPHYTTDAAGHRRFTCARLNLPK